MTTLADLIENLGHDREIKWGDTKSEAYDNGWWAAINAAAGFVRTRPDKLGVHLSHCNFGDNANSCKYGELDCPALSSEWSWFGYNMQRAELREEALANTKMELDLANLYIKALRSE